MAEAKDSIARLLAEQVQPYSLEDRRADGTRLIRLNDAKEMLRDAARNINSHTPSMWRLMFANALEAAGEAIFAFTAAIKKFVKKAGLYELILTALLGIDVALQPVARKFAHFFGQQTSEVVGGWWARLLAYFNPVTGGTLKAEVVDKFFEILLMREIAKRVDNACVYEVQNLPRSIRYLRHERTYHLLPQAAHQRRVRKTIRSRNPR